MLKDAKPPKTVKQIIELLTPEEIARMSSTMNPNTALGARNIDLYSTMLDTGLRQSEVWLTLVARLGVNSPLFRSRVSACHQDVCAAPSKSPAEAKTTPPEYSFLVHQNYPGILPTWKYNSGGPHHRFHWACGEATKLLELTSNGAESTNLAQKVGSLSYSEL